MCTKNGIVKKTTLEAYSRPRQNGINAIGIREGDSLLEAKLTDGNCDIMIAANSGKAIDSLNQKFVQWEEVHQVSEEYLLTPVKTLL